MELLKQMDRPKKVRGDVGMTKTKDFSPERIQEYVADTHLKGKNLTFLFDLKREELLSLFKVAEILEPFGTIGLDIMRGKVMCSLFFEPSTRTRLSTETAMLRLGGSVVTEASPLQTSSAAKDESLWDTLRVLSAYADILVLRHPNEDRVLEDLPASTIPVISGGYGSITHPTQGLLDLYTIYRAKGYIEGLKVLITSPDLSRARSGHSFALALAQLGGEIIYASPKELSTPKPILSKLEDYNAKVVEHFNLSKEDHDELIMASDIVYLPGCRIPKGGEERDLYMKYKENYYVGLEPLQRAKEEKGKVIGVMHSLPRFKGEFDFDIDKTEHELYFKQVAYGIPIRMALITSMIGLI